LARFLLINGHIIFLEEKTMKRIITVMMVMALVGGAAFARGNNENTNGSRQGMATGEKVSVSGTVEEMDGQVVLRTADGIYSLSAPGFYRAGVEVPYGETIEVQGSETEALADCDIDAQGHIFVATAKVNGEEISFSNGRSSNNRNGSGPVNTRQGNSGRGNSGRGNSGNGQSGRGNRWNNN